MTELFKFLSEHEITPNGWYVLYATLKKSYLPGYVNLATEQRRLLLAGYLVEEDRELGKVYRLSETAFTLLTRVEEVVGAGKRQKPGKSQRPQKVPFEQWEADIRDFVEIFPKGSQGSQPIRSTPRLLHERFEWFFHTFPEFDWEDVKRATRRYIDHLLASKDGLTYVSTSKYFVKKEERDRSVKSALADWCSAVVNGDDESQDQGHHYFGSKVV